MVTSVAVVTIVAMDVAVYTQLLYTGTIVARTFAVILLLTGRCYEAEICTILLLLRCPFRWHPFLPKSKISKSGQKPWTIVHVLILGSEKRFEKSTPP